MVTQISTNILVVITNFNHGRGGHFFSCEAISVELSKYFNIVVCVIGKTVPPIFKQSELDVKLIHFRGLNLPWAFTKLFHLVKKHKIEFIHNYDERCVTFTFPVAKLLGIRMVTTKCGGPIKGDFPVNSDLVLFGAEDYNHYTNMKEYDDLKIYHIPNRIRKTRLVSGQEENATIKSIVKDNFSIVRIARLNKKYENSILVTINLFHYLKSVRKDTVLILIGVIEDVDTFEKITSLIKGAKIFLFTEPRYTNQASKYINYFDIVVGTGRGIMEAVSLGKITLSPVENHKYPLLVCESTFQKLFKINFSGRVECSVKNIENSLLELIEIIYNESIKLEYHVFLQKASSNYFEIDSVIDIYISIYSDGGKLLRIKRKDYVNNLKKTILTFLKN